MNTRKLQLAVMLVVVVCFNDLNKGDSGSVGRALTHKPQSWWFDSQWKKKKKKKEDNCYRRLSIIRKRIHSGIILFSQAEVKINIGCILLLDSTSFRYLTAHYSAYVVAEWVFVSSVLQDCDHVSQTAEEFYTVRCQVADMKNIYVSIENTPAPGNCFHTTHHTVCCREFDAVFFLCSGISGWGDHQRHFGGRQHVHLFPVWQEGPRRETVRTNLITWISFIKQNEKTNLKLFFSQSWCDKSFISLHKTYN